MRIPARQEPEDWALLALLVATAVFLLLSENFWPCFHFESCFPSRYTMMNPISLAFNLINGYKTYSSVILAVASGVGMIATKNYSEGLSQIFQGLTVVFGGASVASVRHAVAKVENQGPALPRRHASKPRPACSVEGKSGLGVDPVLPSSGSSRDDQSHEHSTGNHQQDPRARWGAGRRRRGRSGRDDLKRYHGGNKLVLTGRCRTDRGDLGFHQGLLVRPTEAARA